MLSKKQITDSMWNIGKGIADKYNTKDIVIAETPVENENKVKLGYWFTFKRQHVQMERVYTILADDLLHAMENVWEVTISEKPVEEKFKTIGHVFEYLYKS